MFKRASDILSPWVGETEQKIAEIFTEAQNKKAVLLIDEIDSFLYARSFSYHSWEITRTNEFLARIESFNGWLICTTNFYELLDEACLRRFDIKVRFKPLNISQILLLFEKILGKEALLKYKDRLKKLNLTPGMFAIVYRRLKLLEDFSPETFIVELEKESKNIRKSPLGFRL
ncbi:MAG: hypothetical protein DSZ24_04615 [Thermodesulfatator sp.]|nr:MAG: hypothetical protein DSZ24_04615 [Thermodesulfatator sp.]